MDESSAPARYADAYIRALDRGDFTTVAAILAEAQADPDLATLLIEIDDALWGEIMADAPVNNPLKSPHVAENLRDVAPGVTNFQTPLVYVTCPDCHAVLAYNHIAAVTAAGAADGGIFFGIPVDDYRRWHVDRYRPFSGRDVPGSQPALLANPTTPLNGTVVSEWRALTNLGYALPQRSNAGRCPTVTRT